ncbi:exonuclease VIII, partial [Escherichia coli]|nr:exonuclease VIII [Escherichia coli]
VCAACGQSGGGNCPDCGAVMGDTTYQETFNEENLDEYQEKDPEEMEGPEHPHNENAGSDPHRNCSDETGEASAPVATEIMWPSYFEPGRYENLPNEVYHSANGISSTMLKDARISLMYYHGRHIAGTIPNEESDALLRGRIIHSYVLETDKFADEYAIPVPVPEYVVTTSNELIAIIKKHNASLPALMTPEQMKEWIESYNSTLIQPLSVSAGAEETGILYGSLPVEFRRIPEGEKHTASAMKACIKEYNASLPPLLKTSGAREQLLDQIETVDPELAKKERAKSLPYNISGTKEQLTEIARKIRPELVTLEDWQKRQQEENAGKTFISPDMYEQAKNIHAALQNNTDAARLLNHPDRKSEISYFGFDEETGLEIRVRPDIEIRLPYESICADVKSVSLGYVRQERLKDRLHREIIERDYHLSAAMYCDVANLDKFFWIFVNKDAGYHWVAVVEASQELLELGRQEYRRTLRQINEALETNNWPAPITESYTDELNDFDLRRLEALHLA